MMSDHHHGTDGYDSAQPLVRIRLSECLREVKTGVGVDWRQYRVVGATREGIAPAKERVGKNPQRYKPVSPGTIFYNPMRILIGSIAMIDDGEEPAITSPDYVVFTTRAGTLHHKFFYYWLRSISGATFIRRLARGAVRERLMFPRLSAAEVEMPRWDVQMSFIRKMALIDRARAAAIAQLTELDRFPALLLRDAFSGDR